MKKIIFLSLVLVGLLGLQKSVFAVSLTDDGQDFTDNKEVLNKNQYRVKSGDTLWSVAERFYGSGRKWKYIFANNDIGLTPTGRPLLKPGTILIIPEVAGTANGIVWEKLTMELDNTTIRSMAFSPKKNIWLLVGSEGPYNYGGTKPAPLYFYDGKKFKVASKEFKDVAEKGVSSIFFDGEKFWIATGDVDTWHSSGGQIFTFDGKDLIDRSSKIFADINEPYVRRMAGDSQRLLLGGCKGREKMLLFYNGTEVQDLSETLQWRSGCVRDIEYNGEYWLITIDGQLYKFDGKDVEYLSDREELRSIVGPTWKDGIWTIDWDPNEKRWLLAGWVLVPKKGDTPIYALYDIENNKVVDLRDAMRKSNTPSYPGQIAHVNSYGWVIDGAMYNEKKNKMYGPVPWEGQMGYGEGALQCSKSVCLLSTRNDLIKMIVPPALK